ncbi:MAG: PCRF domain-containing protein, partial [Clostridia bacterium]|nr:PCRF domain-containing protein [Clostridia bacterium]
MIIEFEQYTSRVEEGRKQLQEVREGLHVDQMEQELTELHEEMNADGFWDDLERSTHVNKRISQLESKLEQLEKLSSGLDDIETMLELAHEENDDSMVEEAGSELETLEKELEALALETLMRGD